MEENNHDPVDVTIGQRIKLRRKELSMSQSVLAEKVGLTFQQIQKYERAFNRVSSSTLYQISKALNVNISYFYSGLPMPEDDGASHADVVAMEAYQAVPEIAMIPKMGREAQIALGTLLARLA